MLYFNIILRLSEKMGIVGHFKYFRYELYHIIFMHSEKVLGINQVGKVKFSAQESNHIYE